MKNVNCKECEVADCKTQPTYDWPGGKGIRCVSHKQEGMEDVVNTDLCEHVGDDGIKCKTRPSFNLEGLPAKFCKKHSTGLMIDVVNKRCEHAGCRKINPIFGNIGERGRFCKEHKQHGMKDVVNKHVCEEDECSKRPVFDFEGGKGRRCFSHKLSGMIDIHNKRCQEEGCDKINPAYGFEKGKGVMCVQHRKKGMENVVSKKCATCPTIAGRKLQGYCYRCFIYAFPENDIVRNHKTKERSVADIIKSSYPELKVLLDKSIPGGTSCRRPDIFIDMGEDVMIIEIDENQHSHYDCSCENKRLMELFQDAGSRPLTMIRFNPDKYVSFSRNTVPSCWDYTTTKRVATIKNMSNWNERLQVLFTTIDFIKNTPSGKNVDVIHLFYDGWKD
jgi:hypothetical protein